MAGGVRKGLPPSMAAPQAGGGILDALRLNGGPGILAGIRDARSAGGSPILDALQAPHPWLERNSTALLAGGSALLGGGAHPFANVGPALAQGHQIDAQRGKDAALSAALGQAGGDMPPWLGALAASDPQAAASLAGSAWAAQNAPYTLAPGDSRFVNGQEVASVPKPDPATTAMTPDQTFGNENNLRTSFNQLTSDTRAVVSAYARVQASAAQPSSAGDMALIFNYMKMLDPGSTVREGEYATAQNAGGVDDQVIGLYNRVIGGGLLSDSLRADYLSRAERLNAAAQSFYQPIADWYTNLANDEGLDPSHIVVPLFGNASGAPAAPAPAPAAPSAGGGNTAPEGTIVQMGDGSYQIKQNGQWVPYAVH